MSKIKSLGPANDDIPADELFLAKMIQNAKGRKLGWCSGAEYQDKYGERTFDPKKAVACCALGAIFLEKDTGQIHYSSSVMIGNDSTLKWGYQPSSAHCIDGEVVGWCFRLAMTDD